MPPVRLDAAEGGSARNAGSGERSATALMMTLMAPTQVMQAVKLLVPRHYAWCLLPDAMGLSPLLFQFFFFK